MPFDFKGPFVNPQNQQGGQPPAPNQGNINPGGKPGPGDAQGGGGAPNTFTPSPEQQQRLDFLQQQANNSPQAQAQKLQAAVQDAQRQLQMAQMNGAPPNVIMNLQYQLQNAQQALQQAGAAFMSDRVKNRPRGTMGVGKNRPASFYEADNTNYDADTAYLMSLFGMGGGMGPQGGGMGGF